MCIRDILLYIYYHWMYLKIQFFSNNGYTSAIQRPAVYCDYWFDSLKQLFFSSQKDLLAIIVLKYSNTKSSETTLILKAAKKIVYNLSVLYKPFYCYSDCPAFCITLFLIFANWMMINHVTLIFFISLIASRFTYLVLIMFISQRDVYSCLLDIFSQVSLRFSM